MGGGGGGKHHAIHSGYTHVSLVSTGTCGWDTDQGVAQMQQEFFPDPNPGIKWVEWTKTGSLYLWFTVGCVVVGLGLYGSNTVADSMAFTPCCGLRLGNGVGGWTAPTSGFG